MFKVVIQNDGSIHSSPVAFHIKTNYLICTVNHMTGFSMKCIIALKLGLKCYFAVFS